MVTQRGVCSPRPLHTTVPCRAALDVRRLPGGDGDGDGVCCASACCIHGASQCRELVVEAEVDVCNACFCLRCTR